MTIIVGNGNDMASEIYKLFQTLTHGVYIIGVGAGKELNAFTAAWVMQASFQPLMVALSINNKHRSHHLLQQFGVFTVNVLPSNRLDLAEHFGRPATAQKLNSIDWFAKTTSAPVLGDAISYFECETREQCHAGDHIIVTGEVIDGAILNMDEKPMTYEQTGDMDGSLAFFPESFRH